LIVAAPVKLGMDGYNSYSIAGAAAGATTGLIVGTIAG
jgi:hypothetical protein